jgi:hypothetical protein
MYVAHAALIIDNLQYFVDYTTPEMSCTPVVFIFILKPLYTQKFFS